MVFTNIMQNNNFVLEPRKYLSFCLPVADSFCFSLFASKESLQKRIDITAVFFYNGKNTVLVTVWLVTIHSGKKVLHWKTECKNDTACSRLSPW